MSSVFLDNSILLTPTSITNISLGVIAFLIGTTIFLKNKTDEANQLFFLVALNICFWTLSSTLADVFRSEDLAILWARLAIIGPFFLTSFFLLFSYYFPENLGKLPFWKALLILSPSLIAIPFVPTDLNVSNVTLESWGTNFTPGPLYTVLFVHILANYALAARNFVKTYRRKKNEPIVRRQILLLYFGMVLMVASGVVSNLILPLVFSYTKSSVIGPASSAFFVVLIMYAMLKHRLLNVKIIATETFSAALVFIAMIEIFGSDSMGTYILRSVTFSLTALFAVLLIRGINHDEKQREELRKLSQELAIKNEKLREMDQLKSDFISIASHQLRTPISVIKGYLALILDGAYGKIDGSMKEKVTAMIDMAERLVTMINEMLNVSRIERNKVVYMCRMIDVAATARSIVEEMQGKAKEKRMTVRFVAHDAPGAAVGYADGDKVKEILSNLVDNAIKYSTGGSVEVSVQARTALRDVLVTVSDEGYGIGPEDAKHMFEKFYRSNSPEVARASGTGLGLYVCRMFLRDMGGDIWIERTALGKGTVFAFTLPMDKTGNCDV